MGASRGDTIRRQAVDRTGDNKDNGGSFSVSSVISVAKGPVVHPLFAQASGITHDVIGAAIEVDIQLGLIVNFHTLTLAEGVSRLILPGANLN